MMQRIRSWAARKLRNMAAKLEPATENYDATGYTEMRGDIWSTEYNGPEITTPVDHILNEMPVIWEPWREIKDD